ncbi:uncharacterized protein DS421_14g484000 [Arachis hypogaea]|nr:uncharacterized protein DS421_14g484000 [Arachis hypogaea]
MSLLLHTRLRIFFDSSLLHPLPSFPPRRPAKVTAVFVARLTQPSRTSSRQRASPSSSFQRASPSFSFFITVVSLSLSNGAKCNNPGWLITLWLVLNQSPMNKVKSLAGFG